ncbi:retinol dehydrogenase 14 [Penicillium verhagenii]|uniref:retinol dehydrogenase 14 n=1 Tax=Penicillium verhagenii TaxID=1562060 RepID=UPI00254576EE|nr:retinol dehydrogenase 14 [Penicillium verhagenii]KAJ5923846.1 retinol dehydrogenase 14 [Penicillium verhagenii]
MSGLFGLLFTRLTLPSPSAIRGKTILITGANTGLGREAARHAVALGAGTVILGVRTLVKGEDAKANIEASTGPINKGKILVWPIDLESFDSVQAFASRVRKHVFTEGGRLDIAIMNAGIASVEYGLTRDGWEKGIQVNVLSTALLSLGLLPLLLRTKERDPSTEPHLTILTSDIHKSIKFPERNEARILSVLNDEGQWKKSQAAGGATERYGVTKLMDIFIAMEIARIAPRDGSGNPLVIVNAVTPGFCKSDLLTREKAPWILKLIQALIARTVEEGSKTLLHAVEQGMETHGKWLENQVIADPGNIVTSPEAAVVRHKVWTEIVTILHNVDPEVRLEFAHVN